MAQPWSKDGSTTLSIGEVAATSDATLQVISNVGDFEFLRLVLTTDNQYDLTIYGAESRSDLAASGVTILEKLNQAATTRELIVTETKRFPWLGILFHNDGGDACTPVISYELVNGGLAAAVQGDVLVSEDLTGSYSTPSHTAPTMGAASALVVAANADREYLLIVNDSDVTIYIKLGEAAVANQGIRLNANGGSYEMSRKLGNLYSGAVYGIASSGTGKVLLVTEGE